MKSIVFTLVLLVGASPAYAQLGGILKGAQAAKKIKDIQVTDEEERKLGELVSAKVRQTYGVVQDPAVHRYVALVGTVLAQTSTRPALPYTFIVLDTDAVNAFAAPYGYIHITRGALGLIKSEAELANVLGHEIAHVTELHTIKLIEKAGWAEVGGDQIGGGLTGTVLQNMADKLFDAVLAGFGRSEELAADRIGVTMASKLGYAPTGLADFLTRLTERNKTSTAKRGLFASHPETKERLDKLKEQIAKDKLTGTATLEQRYKKHIAYEAKPIADIAAAVNGAAGLTGDTPAAKPKADAKAQPKAEEKAEEPKKRRFGMPALLKPGGEEKKSAQVSGSGGARGVDPEVKAKGGSNPAPVKVTLTPADIAAFKKDGKIGG